MCVPRASKRSRTLRGGANSCSTSRATVCVAATDGERLKPALSESNPHVKLNYLRGVYAREPKSKGSRLPTKLIGGRSSALCCSRRASSRGAYFIAARTSFATSSMSSAFSAGNGRFMSSSSSTVLPPTVTTKAPLRGFSLLTSTVTPGKALASRFALVLNAPQLLQASTSTTEPEEPALGFFAFAADGFLAGALALVFFAITLLSMGFARVPAAPE